MINMTKEEESCAHRQDGICRCPTNKFAPFKCPWADPDVPKDQKSRFHCPDWEAKKCRGCKKTHAEVVE